ncbi:MAG: hypothetical protein GDA67_06065 [Nitrospira sp. CR1.3]|nr:hypothetical protein [Nitrospira sp. CR1.3]
MKAIHQAILCAVMGAVLCQADATQALTVTIYNDDNDNATAGLTRTFEAEGRIGNRATNGTHETDIGPSTSAPAATGQKIWASGTDYAFSLTYNPTTSQASFNVTGASPNPLNYMITDPLLNGFATDTLFLRLFAQDYYNDSLRLDQLLLDGAAVGAQSYSVGNGSGNGSHLNIKLTGSELLDGFTLTGRAKMTFTSSGGYPQNSQLAFQLKGIDLVAVPLPGAVWLFGSGMMGILASRARRLVA